MGHTPVRRCVGCRGAAAKAALVRLAVAGERIVVDLPARQPGRGAYVCRDRACLEAALRREGKPLVRALRRRTGQVTVDEQAIRQQWSEATAPQEDVKAVASATRGSS